MGWIEDSVEEFRKLPTPGKIAVGGAAVGVAILAYAHYRSSGGSAGATSSGSTDNSGLPTLGSSSGDWQNWFNQGLTPPTSDGAPPDTGGSSGSSSPSGSSPVATFAAPATSGSSAQSAAAAHVSSSAGLPPIQNPTAQQDAQHRGTATPSYPIQNPSSQYEAQHRGASSAIQNPTAAAQAAHRGVTKAVKAAKRFIPTTIRPRKTPGRGRAR